MATVTKKELVEHAPKDHFNAEQWQRVYTDYAGGDFLFRHGVELAEKISFEVSMPGARCRMRHGIFGGPVQSVRPDRHGSRS